MNIKCEFWESFFLNFLGFEATKLTPGSVTLDDLTIDSLKQKMQEIEMKLQGNRFV